MQNKLLKVLTTYLAIASFILIVQSIFYGVQMVFDLNFNSWINNHLEHSNMVFHLMGYLFLFGVVNVFICGLSGLVLLIKKHRINLALTCIIAATIFYLCLREVGDSY